MSQLRFPAPAGGTLAGHLELPVGEPAATALFAHCFTCGKDIKAATRIARGLARRGIATLRFDFTGLGESSGEHAEVTFASNVDDLVAAADFLRRELAAPALLVGHSLGGSAVLAAAQRIPEVTAVATLGAPASTEHLRELLVRRSPALAEGAESAELELGGQRVRVGHALLADLAATRLEASIATLGRALLVLHSPVDEVVGIDHARRIYEAARHPKSFVALPDADHLLLRDPADAEYVAAVLCAWASRYVKAIPDEDREGEALAASEVRVHGRVGLAQHVHAGRHHLVADEPQAEGGSDLGPTPYGYLLAALGACTAMTVRLYAARKGWPLGEVDVVLRHDRLHGTDAVAGGDQQAALERIQKEIRLGGDLSAEQRARLLEIADRCPVHRTLSRPLRIESSEVPADET
jgi:putative redox protein